MSNIIYEIRAPNNKIYEISGAPSQEAANEYVGRLLAQEQKAKPIEGFMESSTQQFWSQLAAGAGAGEAVAAAAASPEARDYLRGVAEGIRGGDQDPSTRPPELSDLVSRRAVDAVKAYAGQAAGSIAGMLPATAAGAATGFAVGGPGGAVRGATLATQGQAGLSGISELYRGLVEEGIDPATAGRLAVPLGLAISRVENKYLEQAIARSLGGQVSQGAIGRITERVIGGRAGGVRQTLVTGAGSEMGGEALREAVKAGTTGNLDLAERASRVAEAGIVGGMGGSMVGAATRVAGGAGPSAAEQQQAQAALAEAAAPEAAPAPAAEAAAPAAEVPTTPAFTRTEVPLKPQPFKTPEEASTFFAENPQYAPPTAMTSPEASVAWANAARQSEWDSRVTDLRTNALTNFIAAPQTQIETEGEAPRARPNLDQASTFLSNLAQAASQGNLNNINRFTVSDVAGASMRSQGIEPGKLSKDETKFVTDELNALVADGYLVKPTPSTYGVSYGFRQAPEGPTPRAESNRNDVEFARRLEEGTVDADLMRRMGATPNLPQQPAQEQAPALPEAAPAEGFTTARGSTYEVFPDGTTVRYKAARPEHPGDFGLKARSARTVMLTEDNIRALAPPADTNWRYVITGENKLSLATQRPDGQWGITPSQRDVPFTTQPEVGLHPLELWRPETISGMEGFREVHPGNKIVQVSNPAAPAAPAAPEAAKAAEPAQETQPGEMTQQDPPQEWSPTSNNSPDADVDISETPAAPFSPILGYLPADPVQGRAIVNRATLDSMNPIARTIFSPMLFLSKQYPHLRPGSRVLDAMRFRYQQGNIEIQNKLAEGMNKLKPGEEAVLARLREESSKLGQEAAGVAKLPAHMKTVFDNQIAAMNRAFDYWIAARTIKYFDPASVTDPEAKARLNEFWKRNRNKELWEISPQELQAASPEGYAAKQSLENIRNPYYMPMVAEGTHFVAAYKRDVNGGRIGKPVAMVPLTPLKPRQRGLGRPDPEVYARQEMADRGFTPDKYYITPQPVEFTRDKDAVALRDNSDVLAKYINQINSIRSIKNDTEAQNILNSLMRSMDKDAILNFMRPNQGILIPITKLNESYYLSDTVSRQMAGLSKLQARAYTQNAWDRVTSDLPTRDREYLNDLRDYSSQPQETGIIGRLRTFNFYAFIGPALDSALVNGFQTVTSTIPLLARDSNPALALKYVSGAFADSVKHFGAALKFDSSKFGDAIANAGRTVDERQAIKRAAKMGVLTPYNTTEIGAGRVILNTAKLKEKGIPFPGAVAKYGSLMLNIFNRPQHTTEQMNRATAFIASYRLATDHPEVMATANSLDGKNFAGPDAAFWYALSRTDESQTIQGPEDRAEFLRKYPVAQLATQFMPYTFKMTELMLYNGLNVLKKAKAEPAMARTAALGLAYYGLAIISVAGVWGLPGAEPLREAIEAVIKYGWKDVENFDQDLFEWAQNNFGTTVAEVLTRGGPYAAGMFSGSTRLGLNPMQFQEMVSSGLSALAGPAASYPEQIYNSFQYANRGEYIRAFGALMPRFIDNIAKGADLKFGTGDIRNPGGTTIMSQRDIEEVDKKHAVPTWLRVAVGFPPPEVEKARTTYYNAKELQGAAAVYSTKANEKLANLRAEQMRADARGDREAWANARRRMDDLEKEINARNERLRASGQTAGLFEYNWEEISKKALEKVQGVTSRENIMRMGGPRSREDIREMYRSRYPE